MNYNTK